ncbi:endonuclease IV [Hypnocyclicus thermotrophus]|uniref:Probable endonuclease 4 n=1 Tax=Hypnocyclicus thermotrophus TaxID=1627895 RepID=A0AA46E0X5_9FUSO|nr:deoxyribonuclease IV [Hypnocyclicus thermotrophus]TDT72393.1 endonuclease IV [Hypnocyclicus thermotrophus]
MKNTRDNIFIGAHVSVSGGIEKAPINANDIGAKAFALFTKNQRRWDSKPLDEKNIKKFKENLVKYNFNPKYILPHDSYLINLGNPNKEKREKSLNAFIDELERAYQLGLLYVNTHPGSHLKEISEEECLDLIAESINISHSKTKDVIVVLENTAGQGSNLGYKFEHLAYIIEKIKDKNRIGVCLDTCHTFVAGYDLRDDESYNKTMNEFEKIVGFKYLKGIHLNDSKTEFASKKDRHHSIGKGFLGKKFFKLFMNDTRMQNIPIILETIDNSIWKEEIEYLYSLIEN